MSLSSVSLNHPANSRGNPWPPNTVLLGELITPSESTVPLNPTLRHPEKSWFLATRSIVCVHRSPEAFELRFADKDVTSNTTRGEYTLWLSNNPLLSRNDRYEVSRIVGTEWDAETVARDLVVGSKWDFRWSLATVTYHPSTRPEPVGVSHEL